MSSRFSRNEMVTVPSFLVWSAFALHMGHPLLAAAGAIFAAFDAFSATATTIGSK